MYDTDTAKELIIWTNNYNYNDFAYCEERLYQKKTGEFFLYGEGGPHSKYVVYSGENSWGGGCKIIPLDFEAARAWAEEHADADDYESIFGEVAEDGSKKAIILNLSVTAAETLKRRSQELNQPMSTIVENMIMEQLPSMSDLEVLMADGCTEKEAKRFLATGTIVYNLEDYISDIRANDLDPFNGLGKERFVSEALKGHLEDIGAVKDGYMIKIIMYVN